MTTTPAFDYSKVKSYFADLLKTHGANYLGLGWNSMSAQEIRFDQLIKIVGHSPYSLLDYGCGYGGLYDYLVRSGHAPIYYGYDIVESMIIQGRRTHPPIKGGHPDHPNCHFSMDLATIPKVDYSIASGTFNMKLDTPAELWTASVLIELNTMWSHCTHGLAFNLLTSYADQDRLRPELYYADPCFFFDFCMRNFSRHVTLLHSYNLYDFTILVRKQS